MHIVFTTDKNYLTYMMVAICSICENNQCDDLTFHILLNGDLKMDSKLCFQGISRRYGVSINFYHISHDLLANFPVYKDGQPKHISTAAYIRLLLASILPTDINKVLYFDCDLIVVRSLTALWNTDITDYPIAAVPDMTEADLYHYRQLRYPPKLGYFNSGVLLINLKLWRENKYQEQFENYIKDNIDRILYHDQDVLNYVFRESKMILPIKYNVQEGALYERVNISWEYDEQLEEALHEPVIIHYTTGQKPWNVGCRHPWRSVWLKYLEMSGIKDFKFVKTKREKKSVYQFLRNILVKIGMLEPIYQYKKGL